jgi:Ca2+-binding RTX toxin-like protein
LSDNDGITVLRGLSETDELLIGTDGDDILAAGSGNDSIEGGDGNDRLIGRAGSDSLSGEDGNDRLIAGSGDDVLNGGNGDDTLWDSEGADRHFGGLGQDILVGRAGNDTLFGEDGFDRIYGGVGDDELSGGGGIDLVYGGADDDVISGGDGFDKLTGGDGADIFLIESGSGHDVIRDFQPGTDKIDLTPLNLGISFSHVIVSQMGPHAWVTFRGDEGLTLYNTDASQISANDFIGLSTTTSADLHLVNRSGASTLTGGEGADYVRGGNSGDLLAGGDGDDTLWDAAGDDTLSGGAGDDMLRAGIGADSLSGGEGNDRLHGVDGADHLSGDAGDDFLFGGAGDDTIDGGAGTDILTGGAGADSFIASAGGDVIRDFTPGQDVIDVSSHTIGFGDLTFQKVGPHTAVNLPDSDVILLFNTQPEDLSESDFAFGSTSSPGTDSEIIGTEGDDRITAIDVNSVSGLGGNDTLDLRANFGEAFGGDGNDSITIGLSPSIEGIAFAEAFGGAGDDTITALGDFADAEGGDGNDLIDVSGRSFVDGGAGDDTLSYSGDGVAIFDAGFRAFPENAPGGYVIDGQTATARGIENLGSGIVAGIIGGNGTSGDDVIGDDDGLQVSNLGVSNIFAGAGDDTVFGFAGDDSLRGQFGDDLLFGGDGDDTLTGDAGNDTLEGGAGDNFLTGGAGADSFVLGSATEQLHISDFAVGEDLIDVQTRNISLDQLDIDAAGDDTRIGLSDGSTILLTGVSAQAVSEASFLGLGPSADQPDVSGSDSDDSLDVSGSRNVLGLGGNDAITLTGNFSEAFGGAGNDTLTVAVEDGEEPLASVNAYGGIGDDLISISGTSANVFGGDGIDTLNFTGAELAVVDVDRGEILIDGNISQVSGIEAVSGQAGFGTIVFGDIVGTTSGTTGNDLIADSGIGAFADATINAGAGDDTVVGGIGDDFIRGQFGDDQIFGGDGADELQGSGGNDLLEGGSGLDTLTGGSGADTIFGGTGMDVIDGGDGFDLLAGGGGSDRFVLTNEGGTDSITDFTAGEDLLDVTALGLVFDDLSFVTSGNNLTIQVAGSAITELVDVQSLTESDFIGTGAGSFRIESVGQNVVVTGTDGDDTFRTYDGDIILGDDGDDRFENVARGNFFGGDGEDTLSFGLEKVFVDEAAGIFRAEDGTGGSFGGFEVLEGNIHRLVEPVASVAIGTDNDETFFATQLDIIRGGAGDDTIFGGEFVQTRFNTSSLFGGDGDDRIVGGSLSDNLFGGAGDDVLSLGERTGTLEGGDGNDLLFGADLGSTLFGPNALRGDDGDDTLVGGELSNFLVGGAGDNLYRGGAGEDSVIFGIGNDTLFIDEISGVMDTVNNFGVEGVDRIDMRQSGLTFDDLLIENGRDLLVGIFVSHDGTDIVRLLFPEQESLNEGDFIF